MRCSLSQAVFSQIAELSFPWRSLGLLPRRWQYQKGNKIKQAGHSHGRACSPRHRSGMVVHLASRIQETRVPRTTLPGRLCITEDLYPLWPSDLCMLNKHDNLFLTGAWWGWNGINFLKHFMNCRCVTRMEVLPWIIEAPRCPPLQRTRAHLTLTCDVLSYLGSTFAIIFSPVLLSGTTLPQSSSTWLMLNRYLIANITICDKILKSRKTDSVNRKVALCI